MEVVVLTHKGGQRSDGNVSDLCVSGRAAPLCTAVTNANVGAVLLIKIPVRNLVLCDYGPCKLLNIFC